MKIAVIQASSQKEKNELLYRCTAESVKKYGYEVINFGCYTDETESYSYIDISILIGLLLSSQSADFIVTGCSSGQGMMLACNSLPGILCGYIPTPQDAFLFGRINDGNAVSLPLGLNFGWAGEINLKYTLEKLFEEPFGTGYPPEDAKRKMQDTLRLKEINSIAKRTMPELFGRLEEQLVKKALSKSNVIHYIMKHGSNEELLNLLEKNIVSQ